MGGPGTEARLRRWFSSLSRGVKWVVGAVVTAGAIATAIGAIVALRPDPPPELRAELSDVSIFPEVTLHEYEIRHGPTETASALGGATAPRLVADVMAQTEEPTTTEETTTTTTEEQTTTEETTTTEDGDGQGERDIVREVPVSDEDSERLNGGLDLAQNEPVVSQSDLGAACDDDLSDSACGLRSTVTYLLRPQSEVTEVIVAKRLVQLFEGLRRHPPPPEKPVGVAVNFNVSLTGFRGRTVEVRWSLYKRGGGQVPDDWARGQRVLLVEAEAQKDSGSGEFWVPLPNERGPYFVRLGVYDEDGDRLDYSDKGRFG